MREFLNQPARIPVIYTCFVNRAFYIAGISRFAEPQTKASGSVSSRQFAGCKAGENAVRIMRVHVTYCVREAM